MQPLRTISRGCIHARHQSYSVDTPPGGRYNTPSVPASYSLELCWCIMHDYKWACTLEHHGLLPLKSICFTRECISGFTNSSESYYTLSQYSMLYYQSPSWAAPPPSVEWPPCGRCSPSSRTLTFGQISIVWWWSDCSAPGWAWLAVIAEYKDGGVGAGRLEDSHW